MRQPLPKILNLEPEGYCAPAGEVLRSFAEVTLYNGRQPLDQVIRRYDGIVVRFKYKINRQLIDKASNLKVVAAAVTGTDHMDAGYLQKKKIALISLKGQRHFLDSISATAEYTTGLMLALMRHVPWAFQDVRQGRWERDDFIGCELKGKVLGIVGLGRLGTKVAKYAKAFGMDILYFDPHVRLKGRGVRKVARLKQLLNTSDVVTVHVPLTGETLHLIGAKEFQHMKPGCFFINTSRGQVVDEKALLGALNRSHIAGAALDVLADENRPDFDCRSNPLVRYAQKHGNLLLTPHIGGATKESMRMTETFIAQRLKDFFKRSNG